LGSARPGGPINRFCDILFDIYAGFYYIAPLFTRRASAPVIDFKCLNIGFPGVTHFQKEN